MYGTLVCLVYTIPTLTIKKTHHSWIGKYTIPIELGLGLASWHCLYPPAPPPIHPCRGSQKKCGKIVLQALKPQNGRFPQKGNFQTNLVIQSDLFGMVK